MVEHVLVPIDGSPQSEKALEFAVGEWPDSDVTLVHVIDPVEAGYSTSVLPSGPEEWFEQEKSNAEKLFVEAREILGRDAITRVEVGRPSRTIVSVAKDTDVDHVVIGSHGREGVRRVLLGSVAEYVVRHSPVPVTVVR